MMITTAALRSVVSRLPANGPSGPGTCTEVSSGNALAVSGKATARVVISALIHRIYTATPVGLGNNFHYGLGCGQDCIV
ncbi:hypothetical protein D9M71_655710 [compost metagenome]